MGRGCLPTLGRWIALGFLRLGALVASILLRSLAFLLLNVIGPFCLGMTREVLLRIMAAWRGRRRGGAGSFTADRLAYALAGGTLWLVGDVLVGTVLGLPFMLVRLAVDQPAVPETAWTVLLVVGGLLFIVGAIVGAMACEHEDEPLFKS
jgi:hypothetical protein